MRLFRALFGSRKRDEAGNRKPASMARQTQKTRASVVTNLKSFPFDVVGESMYQDALEQIAGGYRRDSQVIAVTAAIVLDPDNEFDPKAVRVEIDGQTVGFLPAEKAVRVGDLMREQGVHSAKVQAEVRGGWRTNQHDMGHFGVRLKMPQKGWIDFGVGAQKLKPALRKAPSAS